MRKIVLTICLACLLAPTISSGENSNEADDQDAVKELGAVLAWRLLPESVEEWCRSADPGGVEARKAALQGWLEKNQSRIAAVDARVAEVVPLLFPQAKPEEAMANVRAQIKSMLFDLKLEGKTPEETVALCKAETNPASPRWNNNGMPQVQLSLASLYDWQTKRAAQTRPQAP